MINNKDAVNQNIIDLFSNNDPKFEQERKKFVDIVGAASISYSDIVKICEYLFIYPPAEIFYQSTAKKREDACKNVCETIYKLDYPFTNALRQSLTEFKFLYKTGYSGINIEYFKSVLVNVIANMRVFIDIFNTMCKKNQDLVAYCKTNKLKSDDYRKLTYNITKFYCVVNNIFDNSFELVLHDINEKIKVKESDILLDYKNLGVLK